MIEVARVSAESRVEPAFFHARWCDLATHPEWSAGMEYLRLQEPLAIGARGVSKPNGGRPAPFVVTALEPNTVYADTTLLKGARLTVHHEARRHGAGSRLEVHAYLRGRRARRWAGRMGDDVQQSLAVDLARLVELAEKGSVTALAFDMAEEEAGGRVEFG
jgi:GNAT superfamily N-acetyltransferase